jgi:hypothetical protein
MTVSLVSSIAILTVLAFGTLSFSFHFIWSFFEHSMLLLAQTDDSLDPSTFPFSLSTLIKQLILETFQLPLLSSILVTFNVICAQDL